MDNRAKTITGLSVLSAVLGILAFFGIEGGGLIRQTDWGLVLKWAVTLFCGAMILSGLVGLIDEDSGVAGPLVFIGIFAGIIFLVWGLTG